MTEFFPEQTIRYKTTVKRTIVDGLTSVFQNHPDELLQRTKVSIEYPKTEVDYPSLVVRFFERDIFNAGVGHKEIVYFEGESDSAEVSVSAPTGGAVTLSWPAVQNAVGYKVYRGTASNQENQSFRIAGTSFTDNGAPGTPEGAPNQVTAILDTPTVTSTVLPASQGQLRPGTYDYRVTAIAPSEAVNFQHYFYSADIELAVYALSSFDRDLVADSLVQTIAMGRLEAYTNTFYDRVYPPNDLYPDSELHFIAVNSDHIQGFGESQMQTPWGAEDDLIYATSYRFGVFGELYSLPPKVTFAIVQKITGYPYVQGVDPVPTGTPGDDAPWVSNST